LDFGQYGEAGADINFSDSFGLKLAARFIQSETKEFESLNKQKVKWEGYIYFLTLLKNF
jgi:hypothetical protein